MLNIPAFIFILSISFNNILSENAAFILPGYNLSVPDKKLVLPDTLREISGLTTIDHSTVACVQDENGILFIYDISINTIKHQYSFHMDGDYEGIARVEKSMFVLRSDGMLFEIVDYESNNFKLNKYQTGIPADNNEGLCYDAANNRLLIACKSKLGKGPEFKDRRVIYTFDLRTKKLISTPAFDFNLVGIKAFAKSNLKNLQVRTKKKGAITEANIKFFISAIAIHPILNKLYVLSAADHMLFIFNMNGTLEYIEQLDQELFNKSEGITFLSNGDMFISNEAQNKRPTLLRFNYHIK